MEGASFSTPRPSDFYDGQGGLFVTESVDACLSGTEFDLIIRPFGSGRGWCDGGAVPTFTFCTRNGLGSADSRNLRMMATMIEERMSKGDYPRIGIWGVEALLLWNDPVQVREFLTRMDDIMQSRGARGSLILRENLLPADDLRMIRETLTS